MKRYIPLVLAGALGLSGCPGENSPSEFDPSPTGPLTPEQRIAALDAADVLINTLPGANFEEETDALVAFLRSRSEIAIAGASPSGSVWAMFTDGTLFVVVHGVPADSATVQEQGAHATAPPARHVSPGAAAPDRPQAPGSPGFSRSTAIAGPPPHLRAATTHFDAARELPGSKRFRLLNGLGFGHQHDPRSEIKGMATWA